MSRIIEVDLDNPDPGRVQLVVDELRHRSAPRRADPILHVRLLHRLAEAVRQGRVDDQRASEIRDALGHSHPRAVLSGYWQDLVADRPALGSYRGAFPRRQVPSYEAWLAEDPSRLAGVVGEMGRFSMDLRAICQAALDLADAAGIEESVADQIVGEAIKKHRPGGRRVS